MEVVVFLDMVVDKVVEVMEAEKVIPGHLRVEVDEVYRHHRVEVGMVLVKKMEVEVEEMVEMEEGRDRGHLLLKVVCKTLGY